MCLVIAFVQRPPDTQIPKRSGNRFGRLLRFCFLRLFDEAAAPAAQPAPQSEEEVYIVSDLSEQSAPPYSLSNEPCT